MDIEKRNAVRRALSGQDEHPVTLQTDPIDTDHDEGYNDTNKGRDNMTQTYEDTTDYKEMAAFFQTRIGEIQKAHEADLYFLQKQIATLQTKLADNQEDEKKSNVVD